MFNIIEFNNEKFKVLAVYKFLNDLEIKRVKKNLMCDLVLKKDKEFYFCDHIETIDFEELNQQVETIKENINNEIGQQQVSQSSETSDTNTSN